MTTAILPQWKLFVTKITKQKPITKHLVRITFQGESLLECGHQGYDQRLKLVIPKNNGPLPPFPDSEYWYKFWKTLPEPERPYVRTYTCAAINYTRCELEIDFVDHRHNSNSTTGPGTNLINSKSLGTEIGIVGPLKGYADFRGIEYPQATGVNAWQLLIGDLTALPAIRNILAALPENAQGICFILAAATDDYVELKKPKGVKLIWNCSINDIKTIISETSKLNSITTNNSIANPETVVISDDSNKNLKTFWETSVKDTKNQLNSTNIIAWVAGENKFVKILRKFLVEDIKIPKTAVMFMGYWK